MKRFLLPNPETERKKSARNDEIFNKMIYANNNIFGNSSFRPLQEEIIFSVLSNSDVYVISSTGSGKSLCYQLPAVLSRGVTVVISPLLSLVEDQVSALIQLSCGGIPSAYLSSTSTESMIRSVFNDLDRARHGL
jgi:ATP-dependent DNA helicase Q1